MTDQGKNLQPVRSAAKSAKGVSRWRLSPPVIGWQSGMFVLIDCLLKEVSGN